MAASQTTKLINPSVTIDEISDILNICTKAKITPNLVGTQGIGKSEAVKEFAKKHKFDGVIDLRLGQMEIGDLIGLPKVIEVDKKWKTIWGQPVWWPDKGKYVLFLDEWNRAATTDVIQAIFQLILDRRLHTHILPEDCVVVAAMNPADSGFMVNKIRDKALSDRMLHINVQPTSEGWLKWAGSNKLNPDIIDFIRTASDALGNSMFTMERREPTPRAFHALSRVINVCSKEEWDKYSPILASGLIGPERAMQLIKFMADRNYKPLSADDILVDYAKNKDKFEKWCSKDNFRADIVVATLDNLVENFKSCVNSDGFKAKYKTKAKASMDNYAAALTIVPSDIGSKHCKDIMKLISEDIDSQFVLGIMKYLAAVVKPVETKATENASNK